MHGPALTSKCVWSYDFLSIRMNINRFNRIELEVLSVVAQQIQIIQRAIAAHLKRFVFEDTELELDPTCSVFITMVSFLLSRKLLVELFSKRFRILAMLADRSYPIT